MITGTSRTVKRLRNTVYVDNGMVNIVGRQRWQQIGIRGTSTRDVNGGIRTSGGRESKADGNDGSDKK